MTVETARVKWLAGGAGLLARGLLAPLASVRRTVGFPNGETISVPTVARAMVAAPRDPPEEASE
jgi:hypothetical protein